MRWQPSSFPDGETKESQEEHRLWMVKEYAKSQQDHQKVTDVMTVTFSSQRFAINESSKVHSSTEELLQQWPYLRKPEFLLKHFMHLMDFDLMAKLDDQIAKKSQDILNFALASSSADVKAKASELLTLSSKLQMETPKVIGTILLLPHLLKEKEVLFVYKEVNDIVFSLNFISIYKGSELWFILIFIIEYRYKCNKIFHVY